MVFKAIASVLMAQFLTSSKREVIEMARASMLQIAQENARKAILTHVVEKYTEEIEHNVSQYIKALENSNVEVEFRGKPGEAIVTRAEGAIRELEIYLEKQNPDGAIIKYLQTRYAEEGINIITGRLYAGHYINNTGQGTYEIMNKMGYATAVDKTRPWLTGETTIKGIAEMIARTAREIFELTFEDLDLSDEMANMSFTGDIEAQLSNSLSGQGFAPPPTNKPASTKKKAKNKRK